MDILAKIRGRLQTTENRMSHIGYHAHPGMESRKPALESYPYSSYGHMPDIPMTDIIKAFKGSPRFSMAVDIHVEESVGHGYYITTKKDNSTARAAIQRIEEFDRDFNLTDFNRYVAREMIMTGNSFMTPLRFQGKMVTGLTPIPLDSIISIFQRDGVTIHYRQRTFNSGEKVLPADAVLHFSRDRLNASPWGRGVGQTYAAPGNPYPTPEGKYKTPPSPAESDAFNDHMALQLQRAGLPKYLALLTKITDDAKDTLARELAEGEPLSSMVLDNVEGDVKTIGMATQGKFNDQQKRIHENSILALRAPEIAMWDTENVQAYASSQEIAKSIQPMIIGYKMAHARFIEQNILRPIVDKTVGKNAWDSIGMTLNWGQPNTTDIDSIYKVALMMQHPAMKDVFNPNDITTWLEEAGYKTTPIPTDILRKREERAAQVQERMTGKQQNNMPPGMNTKKKRPDNPDAVGNNPQPEKPKEQEMSMLSDEEIAELDKRRAERIFYKWVENKFAVDGNER